MCLKIIQAWWHYTSQLTETGLCVLFAASRSAVADFRAEQQVCLLEKCSCISPSFLPLSMTVSDLWSIQIRLLFFIGGVSVVWRVHGWYHKSKQDMLPPSVVDTHAHYTLVKYLYDNLIVLFTWKTLTLHIFSLAGFDFFLLHKSDNSHLVFMGKIWDFILSPLIKLLKNISPISGI